MKYYQNSTGLELTRTGVQKAVYPTTLPRNWGPENVASKGFVPIVETEKPAITVLQTVTNGGTELVDGNRRRVWVINNKYSTPEDEVACLSQKITQAKEKINTKINEYREEHILKGCSYTFPDGITGTVQLREQDFRNIQGRVLKGSILVQKGDTTTTSIFRDLENENHAMIGSELIVFGEAVESFLDNCYIKSWEHKATLNAIAPTDATDCDSVMTAVDSIKNYDYTTGWPS